MKEYLTLETPERIRAFIFLVKHESLITNLYFKKMNITDPYCHDYTKEVKIVIHSPRDRVTVK